MITPIFNQDIHDILAVFSLSPGSRFQRKELQEHTQLNNVNLDNALTILIQSKILNKEKRFYSIQQEVSETILSIIGREYEKLKKIPLKAYFSITRFIYELSQIKNLEAFLFGSYAKLVFKKDSDIDIAIIGKDMNKEIRSLIVKALSKIEKKFNTTLEIHYFDSSFYKNKKDPLVKDILKNGVKLI